MVVTRGLSVNLEKVGSYPDWLEELKQHLCIDTTDHDILLATLLQAAIATVENFCWISIVQANVTAQWEQLGTWEELPYGPVLGPITVTGPATIEGLIPGYAKIISESGTPVIATYSAGMTTIPQDLKLAVFKLATDNFEQRAGFSMSGRLTLMTFPNDWKQTAKKYRRRTWLG